MKKPTKLDLALGMARRGIRIMPVHHTDPKTGRCSCGVAACSNQGKHPVPSNWQGVATTDEATIRKWFESRPDMNYGCMMGTEWVAVDVDVKKVDGFATLSEILGVPKDRLDEMTLTVASTTGGRHYYFKSDKAYTNTAGTALGPGVDTRAGVGQVVGPGSTIWKYDTTLEEYVEYTYELISDRAIVDIPEAISTKLSVSRERVTDAQSSVNLNMMDSEYAIRSAIGVLKNRPGAVQGKGGNTWTYDTALQVRDNNISEDKCVELMLEYWDHKCEPPWGEGIRTPVRNAYNYAGNKIGNKSIGLMEFADSLSDEDDEVPEHLLSDDEELMGDAVEDLQAKFKKFLFSSSSFLKLDLKYEFVVHNWLPFKGYTILLGKRGSGKSTILMDLICSVATDTAWYGNFVSSGWTVVYMAAEDVEGIKARFEAWCVKNGKIPADNRLLFFGMSIDLLNAREVKEYTKFILEQVGKKSRVLFVVDTWQRATSASEGGQSDEASMQLALDHLEAMCKSFHGPSIIAAHPPKGNDDTMSGTGILENRSDAIWKIGDSEAGVRTMSIMRIKGAREDNTVKFAMTPVPIEGYDEAGKRRTAVVAEPRGTSSAGAYEKTDSERVNDHLFAELIEDILLRHGGVENPPVKLTHQKDAGLSLKSIAYVCHYVMHQGDSGEYPEEWRTALKRVGFTEHELTKVSKGDFTGFKANRSAVAAKLSSMRNEYESKLYLGLDKKSGDSRYLKWTSFRGGTCVDLVKEANLMDREQSKETDL